MASRHSVAVATGRSELPNQTNNVLAFPGVFRGAIDAGATEITEGMKLAASEAIAAVVGDALRPDYVVPSPLDRRVEPAAAEAVAEAAHREGVSRISGAGRGPTGAAGAGPRRGRRRPA